LSLPINPDIGSRTHYLEYLFIVNIFLDNLLTP
jgi:hypothetical protein